MPSQDGACGYPARTPNDKLAPSVRSGGQRKAPAMRKSGRRIAVVMQPATGLHPTGIQDRADHRAHTDRQDHAPQDKRTEEQCLPMHPRRQQVWCRSTGPPARARSGSRRSRGSRHPRGTYARSNGGSTRIRWSGSVPGFPTCIERSRPQSAIVSPTPDALTRVDVVQLLELVTGAARRAREPPGAGREGAWRRRVVPRKGPGSVGRPT